MSYSEEELTYTRAEIAAFCTREAQDEIIDKIVTGQLLLHRTALGLLDPIYFEVDERGGYRQHLGGFFERLFGLEEVRRRREIIRGSPLAIMLFDKTAAPEPQADGDGEKRLHEFCWDFLVFGLARRDQKKLASNLIGILVKPKDETERERAKQMIIDAIIENETVADANSKTGRKWVNVCIDQVKYTLSGEMCHTLNTVLFKDYCTEKITDAAVEIMVIINRHTRSIPVILTCLAWSLENPDERERSVEIFIKFGKMADSFMDVAKLLRRPLVSDNEEVRAAAKRILVEVVKARCVGGNSSREETPFLDSVIRPLVVILPDGERVREALLEIACATSYRGKITDRLIKILENPELVDDSITMMLELAETRPETARFIAYGIVRRFDVENREEYNARLIKVAKGFIEKSRRWQNFGDALAEQLGSENPDIREKIIVFVERMLGMLEQDPAWNVMRKLTWGFASEARCGGTARLFDQLFENDQLREDATSAIAKEVFMNPRPVTENFKSGVNSYFERDPKKADRVCACLTKRAAEDPEARERLETHLGDSCKHIRRIATVAYNLSSPREKGVRTFRERRDGIPARDIGKPNGSARAHT